MNNENFKKIGSSGFVVISFATLFFQSNPPVLPLDPPTQEMPVQRYMNNLIMTSSVSGASDTSYSQPTGPTGPSSIL